MISSVHSLQYKRRCVLFHKNPETGKHLLPACCFVAKNHKLFNEPTTSKQTWNMWMLKASLKLDLIVPHCPAISMNNTSVWYKSNNIFIARRNYCIANSVIRRDFFSKNLYLVMTYECISQISVFAIYGKDQTCCLKTDTLIRIYMTLGKAEYSGCFHFDIRENIKATASYLYSLESNYTSISQQL